MRLRQYQTDILVIGKALAGGFIRSAALANSLMDSSPGDHGSTFGGNPSRGGEAALDVIVDEKLASRALWARRFTARAAVTACKDSRSDLIGINSYSREELVKARLRGVAARIRTSMCFASHHHL